jgi:hypothetical protein
VRTFDPEAEAEDEERADINLLEPEGQAFAKLPPENERVAPSSPEVGMIEDQ